MYGAGLDVSRQDGIARIVFDRPAVLNALSPKLLISLIEVCGELGEDERVRVVRMEGAGPCFSAGADLPAFLAELGGEDAHAIADLGRRAVEAVAALPQVSIAGPRGHCVGGGLVLAGACDIRIAADDVRFLIPELDAGIPLGWGGMAHLIRLVGETVAADWVLSCRPFGAEEALRAGLVSRVVPVSELDEALQELCEMISAKPASVLRATKRQLRSIRAGHFDPRDDAEALLAALRDPEAMQKGMEYIKGRIQRGSG